MNSHRLTPYQTKLILLIIAILIIDGYISIFGATYFNDTFFEANPVLALSKTLNNFIYAVIISKVFAAIALITAVMYLNKNLGEQWGNSLCKGSVAVMGVMFGAIGLINIMVNYNLF